MDKLRVRLSNIAMAFIKRKTQLRKDVDMVIMSGTSLGKPRTSAVYGKYS